MLGLIPLHDLPREDTAETIVKAKKMEVSVKMITGDQIAIAKETARLLKLGIRSITRKCSVKVRIRRKRGCWISCS